MTVHFIGAGPGAADLITLRGARLLASCPVCLHAGSIVAPELLQHCAPGTKLIDTAPMSLDEQIRRLEKHGIPYTLTPGVPSFAAAAAALRRELTIPEVAQSLVLTRISGRASKMPPGETLAGFGRTGATLAIHLAIHAIDRVVAELTPHYGGDCPVAVVFRASWPDERVLTGTLATIEALLAADPMERTAIIFVGRSLAAEGFG
ncbi:MAG: precorrin-4 C(11)-methyltransferase, partial [Mesorhizobium sp.]|uniref:cobalt-precorrin-4/precorrin-4 C(11)-methyltransferase n=1 Tax=Mesorhizobium sp. TaxID=1871066 RepID=UPI00120C1F2D